MPKAIHILYITEVKGGLNPVELSEIELSVLRHQRDIHIDVLPIGAENRNLAREVQQNQKLINR
jgi:hypothetical protein